MEVVGVVLGVIPLIISAMEYYPKVKELGSQYYKFRRVRQDELRQVAFCKELLKLHLRALLQKSDIEMDALLRNPADKIWKDQSINDQLKHRLAGSYDAYTGILAIVERQMAQTLKAAKVDDEKFQDYLADAVVNPADVDHIRIRAAAFLQKVAMQPRIGIHALGHSERKDLLKELETSIKRLKELLEAVDGVSQSTKSQQLGKNYKIPKTMQGFWNRAERVWRLISEHLRCACRSKHCARLWFDKSSMAQDSLGLVFLFDKAMPRTADPWKRHRLKIHRSDAQCTCGSHSIQRPCAGKQTAGTMPVITIQGVDPAPNGAAAPAYPAANISADGLCEILKHHEKEHVCLGALSSTDDDHPYHFMPNKDDGSYDSVPLSSMLDPHARPFFELRPRIKLAAMLASAHLRFYQTPWIPDKWALENICFPRDPHVTSKVQLDMPYVLADFTGIPSRTKSIMSQGFVTLGIVLLELCFGRALETHDIWSDAGAGLNSKDPFHRKFVADLWAKTIDLVIDGPEYAQAVKWCLSESPADDSDERWREDFAMNVLGPLLKCSNMLY